MYWFTSYDPTGTTALALSAALGTLIGYYCLFLSRRMDAHGRPTVATPTSRKAPVSSASTARTAGGR